MNYLWMKFIMKIISLFLVSGENSYILLTEYKKNSESSQNETCKHQTSSRCLHSSCHARSWTKSSLQRTTLALQYFTTIVAASS